MMKHEFEERIKGTVSFEDYEIIELVYTFHPAIKNVEGKDQIAKLYKSFGMDFIKAMLPHAEAILKAENRAGEVQQEINKIVAERDAKKKTIADQFKQICEDIDNEYGLKLADLTQEINVYKKQIDKLEGRSEA